MEVEKYFNDLILADESLSQYKDDYGVQLIGKSLDFKVQEAVANTMSNINELYSPTAEIVLLSKMLYEMAYLKFKKPLQISVTITPQSNITLQGNTRFTDGENLFYLNELQSISAGVPTTAIMTLKNTYTKTVVVEQASLYFKVPLNVTYKELVEATVSLNGKKLVYSQNFISLTSEYSYEVTNDGLIQVVILLGNTFANNITSGVSLEVVTVTTPDDVLLPTGVSIIESGYDMTITDIVISTNNEPCMSIKDMKDYLKFGRKNIGDILLNEDFRQLIIKNVAGIEEIKVWQEADEEKEVGADITHMNKVFLSYIPLVDGTNLNGIITTTVQSIVYGREVVIKAPIIVDLSVAINIKSSGSISPELKSVIVSSVAGYYDDVINKISTSLLYSTVFSALRNISGVDVFIVMSTKGIFKNRNFFRVLEENINIVIQ